MTTYEVRMRRSPGDSEWYWSVILCQHTSGTERVVREGHEPTAEIAGGRAMAAMLNLMNDPLAEIPFIHPAFVCATCERDFET